MQNKNRAGHEIKVFGKGFLVAFSMYSKIPMPQLSWQDENMKYAICFFPFVGAVIGMLSYGWYDIAMHIPALPEITRVCVGVMLPILLTGGIHIDGYMDTCDALHSYQSRERKLEILKDSHIGAFAVIMLFVLLLGNMGAYAMLLEEWQVKLWGCCYALARILSGISVVSFPNAKKDGTLYAFSSHAQKKFVRGMLMAEALVCIGFMCFIQRTTGIVVTIGALLVFYFYRRKSIKEFGGITGDLAGWFLCLCELISCWLVGGMGFLI